MFILRALALPGSPCCALLRASVQVDGCQDGMSSYNNTPANTNTVSPALTMGASKQHRPRPKLELPTHRSPRWWSPSTNLSKSRLDDRSSSSHRLTHIFINAMDVHSTSAPGHHVRLSYMQRAWTRPYPRPPRGGCIYRPARPPIRSSVNVNVNSPGGRASDRAAHTAGLSTLTFSSDPARRLFCFFRSDAHLFHLLFFFFSCG
jgi:hypothetical protein